MFEKIKSSIIQAIERFQRDRKAAVGLKGILMAIVGLSVGLYVAAAILPQAIVNITSSTNWTGAPSVVITLATTVVGIVAVVALIMLVLKYAK